MSAPVKLTAAQRRALEYPWRADVATLRDLADRGWIVWFRAPYVYAPSHAWTTREGIVALAASKEGAK
jgi:hypothetical protein